MRWLSPLVLALLLSGCAPKKAPVVSVSAQTTLDALQSSPRADALRARFKIRIDGPDLEGSTRAGLLLQRPDRVRLDIFTPIGTPLLLVATDGEALHAWLQREAEFYRGDDAVAVLTELTGGVVAIEDLLDLLTGRLPVDGAEVRSATPGADGLALTLQRARAPGYTVEAVVDPGTLLLRHLRVRPTDAAAGAAPLLEARYGEPVEADGGWLPSEVTLHLPSQGWTVTLDSLSWEVPDTVPDVFELQPAPGATERDLVERLRAVAGDAGG